MIYVTGGAGFIGSNLISALSMRPDFQPIVVADALGCADKWKNLSKHLIHALIPLENTVEGLDAYADDITAVFHLGAISSTTETDADKIMNNNFTLSAALWDRCAEYNIPFIYASSAATYGDGTTGFNDDFVAEKLNELRPLNPYGWSKHLFDRWVCYQVSNHLPTPPQWAGLKFFNVYGPNEYHKEGQKSVIATLVPQILQSGTAKLFKSYHPDFPHGGQQRDFIYVDDCVRVMEWLYESPHVSGLFNVGTGQARSFNDLALATFAALGRAPHIEYVEMPETIRDKYQYFTQANITQLAQAGFKHKITTLEEGVRDYVQGYLQQDDPYR